MRLRTKAAVGILVGLAAVVLVFVPLISAPLNFVNGQCGPLLCLPDRVQSVTRYFFGFGGESSYGGRFYYFCTNAGCSNSWFG